MRTLIPTVPAESTLPFRPTAPGFYVTIVGVMTGVVLLGFWPYYAGLFNGESASHWVVHLHAAVFSGWILLLMTQVFLVRQRRVRVHQRVGRLGLYYGLLVLILGLVITVVAPVQHVIAGRATLDEAAGFLILPLGDMLLFAGFFGAGMAYRRKKELHKRLMVLATIALLFAPAARIGGDVSPLVTLAIWLLPLGLAMAHDAVTRHRVERVYFVGAAVLLVAFARIYLMETQAWLVVGRRLLSPFVAG